MSTRTFALSDELYEYLLKVSLRETDLLRRLREETAKDEMARMQVSPEQGQFMSLLVRIIGAKRTLEVGVFTGYSSLSVALALPDDGTIIACDVSEQWTAIARRYWKEAGVAGKIDLRLAPAIQTLDGLLKDGNKGGFDFAFIDADKQSYDAYYELCLKLLRVGGVMALDNVFQEGKVLNADLEAEQVQIIDALNKKILNDARVNVSLLPIADGLTLAVKK